jgi:hypothetical protein
VIGERWFRLNAGKFPPEVPFYVAGFRVSACWAFNGDREASRRLAPTHKEIHMAARKVAIRAGARAGAPQQEEPRRSRVVQFLLVTLGAGVGAGLFSLIGNSLLLDLQNVIIDVHSNVAVQTIEAKTLFPPSKPVQKIVDVYDPAPPAAAPKATPKATTSPSPSPSPTRPPRRSPSPCPSRCDD